MLARYSTHFRHACTIAKGLMIMAAELACSLGISFLEVATAVCMGFLFERLLQ